MPYEGHCNCGNIHVTLPQQPAFSIRCHCYNCSRSGGGGSSLNYVSDDADITVQDPHACLKRYKDTQTTSGNTTERFFCSNCGSPIMSAAVPFPGKKVVKASLFEAISIPTREVYTHRRQAWADAVEGAEQL